MDTAVILTSAAVGAIVSSIVSSIVTALSQFYERRVRRDELLIKSASELAIKYADFYANLSSRVNGQVIFPHHMWLVYDFHKQLQHLMKHGKLPKDLQEKADEFFKWADSVQRA